MKRRTFCASSLACASAAVLPLRLLAQGAPASDVPFRRGNGSEALLPRSDIADLRKSLRGSVLLAGDDGYDAARRLWNGAFDRRPALIARCHGAADVIQAVNFARAHSMLLAVRGGGHSLSGQSVCDGGLVIDLSRMRSVRVNPDARTARVEPGVLLGEFDREAQFFGLVTTAGTVSDTGAAGLTLGGGFGRLARRFALACDNLRAADVVTARGELVHTSAEENPELLWGLRGGGGNFGVVTSFEYDLHGAGPMMYGGSLAFTGRDVPEVLRFFSGFAAQAPDELNTDCGIFTGPNGELTLGFDVCYSGPLDRAEAVIAPLRGYRKPARDMLGVAPYVALQTRGDAANAAGRGYYERSGFVRHIEPALIDAVVEIMQRPHPRSGEIVFVHHGGAIARVKPEATAFWNRGAGHTLLVGTDWDDPHDAHARDECTGWARQTFAHVESFTQGFYVNTLSADDPHHRVRTTYGGNYSRLVQLKDRYDPTNLFRLNANVAPSRAPSVKPSAPGSS